MWTLVSRQTASAHSVVDKIQPSRADEGDGANNATNCIGDVVVRARRMGDAVAAGTPNFAG
jgi:hypothetical protein